MWVFLINHPISLIGVICTCVCMSSLTHELEEKAAAIIYLIYLDFSREVKYLWHLKEPDSTTIPIVHSLQLVNLLLTQKQSVTDLLGMNLLPVYMNKLSLYIDITGGANISQLINHLVCERLWVRILVPTHPHHWEQDRNMKFLYITI